MGCHQGNPSSNETYMKENYYDVPSSSCRLYRNVGPVVPSFAKRNPTVDERIERMVFANAHVQSGVMLRAALANNDVAGLADFSAENFESESLAVRFATVFRTTYSFFVCHFCKFLELSSDFFNLDLRKLLPMAVKLPVAFPSLLVENQHLLAFNERIEDFRRYFRSFERGSANADGSVPVGKQNLVKFDLRAFFTL
jgi:hypothetical protein